MPSGEVLFVDGFDHYDQSGIPRKWDAFSVAASNWDISTSTKRTGRAALRLTTNQNHTMTKYFPINSYNTTVGLAHYYANFNDDGTSLVNAGGIQCNLVVGTGGSLEFWRGHRDLGGTKLDESASGEISTGTWHYLEFSVHTHQTAGRYEVHLDGNFLFSGEGVDTCQQSATNVTGVQVHGSGTYGYVDDFYVLSGEEILGDTEVNCLYPNEAGQYTQWTPSGEATNYDCVDDIVYSSGEYVVCSGENLIDTYGFGDLTEYVVDNIHGVQIVSGNRKDGAGSHVMKHVVRIGSSDYSGENIGFSAGASFKHTVYTLNPDDDAQWEFTDINDGEFGIKRVEI